MSVTKNEHNKKDRCILSDLPSGLVVFEVQICIIKVLM